jgi:hypothetical protein
MTALTSIETRNWNSSCDGHFRSRRRNVQVERRQPRMRRAAELPRSKRIGSFQEPHEPGRPISAQPIEATSNSSPLLDDHHDPSSPSLHLPRRARRRRHHLLSVSFLLLGPSRSLRSSLVVTMLSRSCLRSAQSIRPTARPVVSRTAQVPLPPPSDRRRPLHSSNWLMMDRWIALLVDCELC